MEDNDVESQNNIVRQLAGFGAKPKKPVFDMITEASAKAKEKSKHDQEIGDLLKDDYLDCFEDEDNDFEQEDMNFEIDSEPEGVAPAVGTEENADANEFPEEVIPYKNPAEETEKSGGW